MPVDHMNCSSATNSGDEQHPLSPAGARVQFRRLRRFWTRRSRCVTVVNGHPDLRPGRYCAALSSAYAEGARIAGHDVHIVNAAVAWRCGGDYAHAAVKRIQTAEQLVFIYPLWFDRPPAFLNMFLEHCARQAATGNQAVLAVVTMDMPAFLLRGNLRGTDTPAGLASTVALSDLQPSDAIFIGTVASMRAEQRQEWIGTVHDIGAGRQLVQH